MARFRFGRRCGIAAALLLLPAVPAQAAVGAVGCAYHFQAWPGGFTADLAITNHGPDINGWSVRWTFRSPTSQINAWQARITQPGPYAVTAVNQIYNAVIPTDHTASFGWTAVAAGTEAPTDITVNGTPC